MKKLNKYAAFAICAVLSFSFFLLTGCEKEAVSGKNVDCLKASEYWYHYDEVSGESEKISFRDDMTMELEVLDYSDYHLLLKIDGVIKGYTYSDSDLDVVDSEKYLAGYSGEYAVIGGSTEEVVLGPYDYDGDVEYPENAIRSYPLAENVEASTLYEFTMLKDGEVVENKVDYQEIDLEEAVMNMECGGYGFIWFNDNMEVSKILFYGAIIAEE